MHAREFIKPAPVSVKMYRQNEGQPIETLTRLYSFDDYLGEFVWSYARWGEDGWDDAQIRIAEAIDATEEGQPVPIDSIDDWEKLHEANKAAKLTGNNAPRVRRLQRAIKSARSPKTATASDGTSTKGAPAS